MQKIYVEDSNKATIICSKCGFQKSVDVTKSKDTQKNLVYKCRCGEDYEVCIERRKEYRKDVELFGEYSIQTIGEKGDIIVRDLSMIGIRFECLNPHHISRDDTVKVKFKLDDPKRSEIKKSVKVVWVKDRIIGAYFIETKSYKADLGFYLQL